MELKRRNYFQLQSHTIQIGTAFSFKYKLGENWQTRAWDPVFKTAGFAPDAAMILGLFSQK
jgi:hypothetical protein